MTQRVVDEIGEQALDRQRFQPHGWQAATLRAHRKPLTLVAFDHALHDLIDVGIDSVDAFTADPREVKKLADHGVDVGDILHHAFHERWVGFVTEHFEAQPDACQRRAQIMRNAGQ